MTTSYSQALYSDLHCTSPSYMTCSASETEHKIRFATATAKANLSGMVSLPPPPALNNFLPMYMYLYTRGERALRACIGPWVLGPPLGRGGALQRTWAFWRPCRNQALQETSAGTWSWALPWALTWALPWALVEPCGGPGLSGGIGSWWGPYNYVTKTMVDIQKHQISQIEFIWMEDKFKDSRPQRREHDP